MEAKSVINESASIVPAPLAIRMPDPSERASQKTIFPDTLYEFMAPVTQYRVVSVLASAE